MCHIPVKLLNLSGHRRTRVCYKKFKNVDGGNTWENDVKIILEMFRINCMTIYLEVTVISFQNKNINWQNGNKTNVLAVN